MIDVVRWNMVKSTKNDSTKIYRMSSTYPLVKCQNCQMVFQRRGDGSSGSSELWMALPEILGEKLTWTGKLPSLFPWNIARTWWNHFSAQVFVFFFTRQTKHHIKLLRIYPMKNRDIAWYCREYPISIPWYSDVSYFRPIFCISMPLFHWISISENWIP